MSGMAKRQSRTPTRRRSVSKKIRRPSAQQEAALENTIFSRQAETFVQKKVGKTEWQLLRKWKRKKQASFSYRKDENKNPFFHIEVNQPDGGATAAYRVHASSDLKSIVLERLSHHGETQSIIAPPELFLRRVTIGNASTNLRATFPYTTQSFARAVQHAILAADLDARRAFGEPVLRLHRPG